MKYCYIPKGVCSKKINFEIQDGIITKLSFEGGCDGNLKGLSSLSIGRPIEEVVNRLSGIKCGKKKTSCPDQLAKAIKTSINN